jgi:flagellar L-ring protein FlgH
MKKIILILTILMISTMSVSAESLFTLQAAQNYSSAPKSLFGGVQARQVGDLISIVMSESVTLSDNLSYSSDRSSTTVDNFTGNLNRIFGISWFKDVNNFGGSNEVESGTKTTRALNLGDTIAVQVVQQLANGNLLVQGKKVLVNSNERMDMVVTGLIDPRWISATGTISSNKVANLQFAVSGRGTVSRSDNEGILNRVIKYFF